MPGVFFKFRSAKDYDTIEFDESHIQLTKLKQAIVTQKKIKSADFDLVVENAQSGETYADENVMIPKNTSLIVKRVPVNKGTATLGMNADKRYGLIFYSNKNSFSRMPTSTFGDNLYAPGMMMPMHIAPPTGDESDQIAMLVNSTAHDWLPDRNPHMMTQGGYQNRRQPPPNYVCHRCKKPGHFIQHCPTNGDPNFNIKTVRKPTGIPRSFLRQVAGPGDNDGTLALGDGVYAVMEPNESEFNKITTQEKSSFVGSVIDGHVPDSIKCPLCHSMFKDAVLLPCCGETFCNACITNYVTNDPELKCPKCKKSNTRLDDMVINVKTRAAVEEYKRSLNSNKQTAPVNIPIVQPFDHFAPVDNFEIDVKKEKRNDEKPREEKPRDNHRDEKHRDDRYDRHRREEKRRDDDRPRRDDDRDDRHRRRDDDRRSPRRDDDRRSPRRDDDRRSPRRESRRDDHRRDEKRRDDRKDSRRDDDKKRKRYDDEEERDRKRKESRNL